MEGWSWWCPQTYCLTSRSGCCGNIECTRNPSSNSSVGMYRDLTSSSSTGLSNILSKYLGRLHDLCLKHDGKQDGTVITAENCENCSGTHYDLQSKCHDSRVYLVKPGDEIIAVAYVMERTIRPQCSSTVVEGNPSTVVDPRVSDLDSELV